VSLGSFGTPFYPLPPKKHKKTHKNKGVGHVLFLTHCLSHLLFLVHLLALWFAYKSAVMMLLIVPVSAGQSVYGPRIGFLGLYNPCQQGRTAILAIATLCRAISSALQGSFKISCAHLQGNFKIVRACFQNFKILTG
jgi:hypothetical protein